MDPLNNSSNGSVAALYQAAITGSVASLDAILLEQYGSCAVLHRASLATFPETPLHLAALLGHHEFSKRLLELIPEMALEQDSEQCTPLHLAAAKGHDQVVRELLKGAGEKACLVQDQEGRVPIHLAAMRGRVSVVRQLLKSNHAQQSVKMKLQDGDSVLHLCVKYNHLDVLKVVLGSTNDSVEVLKMTDSRGNTVLHLAVMLKHREALRYLLELPRVRKEVMNTSNCMGFTAPDLLNNSLKDFKSLEIHELLAAVAVAGTKTMQPSPSLVPDQSWKYKDGAVGVEEAYKTWWDQFCNCWKRLWNRLMDYKGDWMNDTKGSLMMVASIIATVTFQAGISPPGGVWQEDTTKSAKGNYCSLEKVCVAGTPVLAAINPEGYMSFMKCNLTSLAGSLMVVFLLVSGFPLNNKFCLWILSVAMCVIMSMLGVTYLIALWLMIPTDLLHRYGISKDVSISLWFVMVGIVGFTLLVRLSFWLPDELFTRTWYKAAWMMVRGHCSSIPKRLPVNLHRLWVTRRGDGTSKC